MQTFIHTNGIAKAIETSPIKMPHAAGDRRFMAIEVDFSAKEQK